MNALTLPFSPAMSQFFKEHGYFISERVLPRQICLQWRARALSLSREHARSIRRAAMQDDVLRYEVVTGDIIKTEWPELFALYTGSQLKSWIEAVTGLPAIFVSPNLQSAININVLARPGDVYRWHFDAVPYTLLLYLCDSAVEDGGALQFYPNADRSRIGQLPAASRVEYFPRMGDVVLMDGTRCYHRVAPILRPHLRISVPMVFPCQAEHSRPRNLDSYLYDGAA